MRARHGQGHGGFVEVITALAATAMVLAGCATVRDGPTVTFPPSTFGSGAVTDASTAAQREIDRALGTIGLFSVVPRVPYRPAEAPRFAAAPRTVLQVSVPDVGTSEYISIYEFPDAQSAAMAAREQAAYVASPVGRVQFPTGTDFTIRQLGSTIVLYTFLPQAGLGRSIEIAKVLRALGTVIEVPR